MASMQCKQCSGTGEILRLVDPQPNAENFFVALPARHVLGLADQMGWEVPDSFDGTEDLIVCPRCATTYRRRPFEEPAQASGLTNQIALNALHEMSLRMGLEPPGSTAGDNRTSARQNAVRSTASTPTEREIGQGMSAFRCESCNTSGTAEDLMQIVMWTDLTEWQFVHFNNEAGRAPTLVCRTCHSGFDKALFGNKIKKRAAPDKVERLLTLASHMFVEMQQRRSGRNDDLGRFIDDYARKHGR